MLECDRCVKENRADGQGRARTEALGHTRVAGDERTAPRRGEEGEWGTVLQARPAQNHGRVSTLRGQHAGHTAPRGQDRLPQAMAQRPQGCGRPCHVPSFGSHPEHPSAPGLPRFQGSGGPQPQLGPPLEQVCQGVWAGGSVHSHPTCGGSRPPRAEAQPPPPCSEHRAPAWAAPRKGILGARKALSELGLAAGRRGRRQELELGQSPALSLSSRGPRCHGQAPPTSRTAGQPGAWGRRVSTWGKDIVAESDDVIEFQRDVLLVWDAHVIHESLRREQVPELSWQAQGGGAGAPASGHRALLCCSGPGTTLLAPGTQPHTQRDHETDGLEDRPRGAEVPPSTQGP